MGNAIISRFKRVGTTLWTKAGESIKTLANITGATYGEASPFTDVELGKSREHTVASPINGFDLLDANSMPDLTFDTGTRTFTCAVKGGQPSFYFWVNGIKVTKTTTQSVIIPATTGTYYIVFNNAGTLVYETLATVDTDTFYEYAIAGLVYWNNTASTAMVGDERHGIRMNSRDHHYEHSTIGARYETGMDLTGLTNGGTTYTNTSSGYFWDEDIRHTIALQATAPFIYRLGATGEWTGTTPDNLVGYKDGADTYFSWNEWTGATWQLTQGGATTDFWIIFYIVSPDIGTQSVKKILGHNAYANALTARNAIESERNSLSLEGLPSPEFIFLYATIIKRDGTTQAIDAAGNLYLDLRAEKGGTGSASPTASIAANVTTDTTNFDKVLSATDVDVQTALETLDEISLTDDVNVETLSADKTLVEGDAKYQILTVSVNREITLPTSPTVGTSFVIKNNSSATSSVYITVKNGLSQMLEYLYATSVNTYIWDGTYWTSDKWNIDNSRNPTEESNIYYGANSKAYSQGTAIGKTAVGYNYGAAVGTQSEGHTRGVGIGYDADGANYGVGIGYKTNSNNKYYSNAIGYYSETERYGETSINIDGQSDQENNHGLIGLTVDTSNATPTVMLAGSTAGQRALIRANSIMVFEIQIGARDDTTGDCAAYTITGAIKRDGAGNTALIGTTTYDIIAEDDATWDVAVTADDTNDALQIEVTGDATNTVQWVASIKYTETHF